MPTLDLTHDVIDGPDFKEDAVREEIVHPLLVRLGYSSTSENQIIRSKSLSHPFVRIGTTERPVQIVPDYLLAVGGKNAWVLDAKAPKQNIMSGGNVEQAYSYAIHPEVRVHYFALCNGKEFSLFEVNSRDPLLHFKLKDLEEHWPMLHRFLGPQAFRADAGPAPASSPAPTAVAHDYLRASPIDCRVKARQRGSQTRCVRVCWCSARGGSRATSVC